MDDVLPTDKSEGRRKINLKEERGSDVNASVNLDNTLGTNAPGGNNRTPDVTLLSLGGVMSATRIMDQNGTFVISRQSLDRASPSAMSRMLMTNLQGGHNGANGGMGHLGEGNLRLLAGMCDVGRDGALLMPGTRASVFVNGEARNNNENEDVEIFPEGLSPGPGNGNDELNDFGAGGDEASFQNDDGGEHDWGGGDDDGVGFELNDEHNNMDGMNNINLNGQEKREDEEIARTNPLNAKQKVAEDPWAVLDLHEQSKERAQPLRIGVTYRLPPEIDEDDLPSAAVTGSRTKKKTSKNKSARGQEGNRQRILIFKATHSLRMSRLMKQ